MSYTVYALINHASIPIHTIEIITLHSQFLQSHDCHMTTLHIFRIDDDALRKQFK